MKLFGLILLLAAGCGRAGDSPAVVTAEASAQPPQAADGAAMQGEVEALENEAARILDAIFLTQWPDAVDAKATADLAKSRGELQPQLAAIDRKIAAKLPGIAAIRGKDAELKDKAQREAAIWRQRVASSEVRVRAAEPLIAAATAAAERLIAENNAAPVDQRFRDNANREATETVRSARKDLATIKLQLEKERRRLRLYE